LASCTKTPIPVVKKDLRFVAQSGYGSLSITKNGSLVTYSQIEGRFDTTIMAYPGDYEFILSSVAPGYSWVEIYHNDTLVAKDAVTHSKRVGLKTNYRVK
jgi:hypothetical protein